jgi:hypothetical protein
MSTDAKRAWNYQYLKQFKQVSLRFLPEDLEKVKAAAAAAGQGVAPYIMQACRDRMSGKHDSMNGGGGLPDELRQKIARAAEAAGEDPAAWLARAVNDTADRDRLVRMMKR